MTIDNPSDALAGGEQNVPSTDGNTENAVDVKGESAPLHEVLNEALGTSYKSPEDAVTGLKETRNYVGRAGKYAKAVDAVVKAKGVSEDDAVKYIMETVTTPTPVAPLVEAPKVETPVVKSEEFVSKAEFAKAMFYKDNPDLVPFSTVLDSMASTQGKSHVEVAKDETFTSLVNAKKAQDESDKSKSVLTSSPKLGQVADKMTQAQEAAKNGKHLQGAKLVTEAVMEAFDIK